MSHTEKINGHDFTIPDYSDPADVQVIMREFALSIGKETVNDCGTAKTFTKDNLNSINTFTGGTATLPADSTDIPLNSSVSVLNVGSADMTAVGAGGVTLVPSGTHTIEPWRMSRYLKTAPNTWTRVS